MTAVVVDLPAEVFARLEDEAARQGKPPAEIVQEWLTERLMAPSLAEERQRGIAAVRAAGLLAEPSAEMLARAAQATMTLEEVSDALAQYPGMPLSELVLQQRGSKE